MFYQLLKKVDIPFDGIYLWSSVFNSFRYEDNNDELYFRKQIFENIKENLIVIAVKDHLSYTSFNPWVDTNPDLIIYLKNLFKFYKDKQFILMTSLENLESYIKENNVKIVAISGDITNQSFQYKQLKPTIDKNFDSNYNFISLNRNPRPHRLVLVSLLHGLGLQEHGLISYIEQENTGNIDSINWVFNEQQQPIKNIIDIGYEIFKNSNLKIKDNKNIYGKKNYNNNVENFVDKLQQYYKETFVEIVTETSYTESSFLLTEKFLNSVYGCNFPIVLCSKGTVEFLRKIGFDMFDDIIDHSYDLIDNPIDRLYSAIYNNRKLLTDNNYIKELWIQNKYRFDSNINVAKTTMYDFFENRANIDFTRCLNDINL
jgi:hypothetical protein